MQVFFTTMLKSILKKGFVKGLGGKGGGLVPIFPKPYKRRKAFAREGGQEGGTRGLQENRGRGNLYE